MSKLAAIHTLGCKVNQYDELMIAQSLMDAGFIIVPFNEIADLYVINTCTVTHRGDADSRKAARNALRRNPEALIIVAGCYSQWAKDEISKLKGVDLIVGNQEKMKISSYLPDPLIKLANPEIHVSEPSFSKAIGDDTLIPLNRSRALLKIQDGCDQHCTYCIVPHVRGKPRSLERKKVISRIVELTSSGFREIVITGVHLGIWGREFEDNLVNLVKSLDDLDGQFRIRLSSIEPMELSQDLIKAITSSNRICRHLHIPIQNASDNVLKSMRRPYTIDDILKYFDEIKSIDSGWNIGTDLMIGFPTETDQDFTDQLDNLKRMPIDYYHLFTFSPRKGTPAAEFTPHVPSKKIKLRLNKLKKIDRESRKHFINSQISRPLTFIVEKYASPDSDINMGLSDNYLRARIITDTIVSGYVFGELYLDEAENICVAIRPESKKRFYENSNEVNDQRKQPFRRESNE